MTKIQIDKIPPCHLLSRVAGRTDLSSKTKKVFFCTSVQIHLEDKFCASRQVPFRGLKPSSIGVASSPGSVLGSGSISSDPYSPPFSSGNARSSCQGTLLQLWRALWFQWPLSCQAVLTSFGWWIRILFIFFYHLFYFFLYFWSPPSSNLEYSSVAISYIGYNL